MFICYTYLPSSLFINGPKLGVLKHHFPNIPVLAVTATASDRVRHDCVNILRMKNNYKFFRSTANRPNLNYSVRYKQDSKDAVINDMVAFIQENHAGEAGTYWVLWIHKPIYISLT